MIALPAGVDGSVQGLEEQGWQYNNVTAADWDGDGRCDLIVSGIRGEHVWFLNVGFEGSPLLAAGELLEVEWVGEPLGPAWLPYHAEGDELITVWRTRPTVLDWDGDGLADYITLDHKDEMAWYRRDKDDLGNLILRPGENIFEIEGPYSQALVWNRPANATAGRTGRTVFSIVDWDRDGDFDLIMDNVNGRYYENVNDNAKVKWVDRGDLVKERLTNHNDAPTAVDWDGDGWCDLFVGAESGRVFYFARAYIEDGAAWALVFE